jgi:hypothetical protein
MAVWYDTLPIKDLFDDDDSDANVGRIAMIVHDRLTKARPRTTPSWTSSTPSAS